MEQEGDEGQPRQHPMEESDRDAGPTFRGDEGQEAETHTSRGTVMQRPIRIKDYVT